MHPTRMATMFGATVAAVLLATGPAYAGNGHFIGNATSVSSADISSVTVKFKEAGLESGSVETIVLSASVDATYQCINGGGHNANATNKSEEHFEPSASGDFTAAKNGNVVGSLSVSVPSVDENSLVCPNGQREQLSVATWSNIELTDTTSGAYLALPGSFTFGQLVD